MKRSPITPNISRLTDEQLRRNSTLKPIARQVEWQRSPIRKRSEATEKLYVKRRALVTRLLAARPMCERCGASRSTEIHEPKTRARGGSILDEANCVALCHICHRWCHDHPAEATNEGFLKSRWGNA